MNKFLIVVPRAASSLGRPRDGSTALEALPDTGAGADRVTLRDARGGAGKTN